MQASPAPSSTCWSCGAAAAGVALLPGLRKNSAAAARHRLFRLLRPARKSLRSMPTISSSVSIGLSWKLHPDNFVRAAEDERQSFARPLVAIERRLPHAARSGRPRRIPAGCAGMRKEGQTKQQAPPELLEEVFELNESLDELREWPANPAATARNESPPRPPRVGSARASKRNWPRSTQNWPPLAPHGTPPWKPMPTIRRAAP